MVGLIVARSRNGVIGRDGRIPWKIKGEQSQFRELTTRNAVIMGRKTYEEIGNPLPHRLTVVVSKTETFGPFYQGDTALMTARSLKDAIVLARDGENNRNVYIAGGYGLFDEALEKDLIDKIFLTEVDLDVEGSHLTYLPPIDKGRFEVRQTSRVLSADENGEPVWFSRFEYSRERTRQMERSFSIECEEDRAL